MNNQSSQLLEITPRLSNSLSTITEDKAEQFFEHDSFKNSRLNALRDGRQINLTQFGLQAGFRLFTFITRAAYKRCIELPDGNEEAEHTRAWNVVWMLRNAIRMQKGQGKRLNFVAYVRNGNTPAQRVSLVAEIGDVDFDDDRTAMTIMLPEEAS